MPFELDNKLKTSILIYAIIIAIVLIQKPKLLFNDKMELKILVLTKDKKCSIPILYVFIVLAGMIAYYLPRM
jgi:hypothetical protein